MANLIERQAAIDALCKSECGCSNAECRHKDGTDFYVTCDNVKIIKSLPSIQPERKGTRLSTVCLLCKKPAVTFNTEDDIPYTNYSYCEDCLRKGLNLLREQKKNLQAQPERKMGHWICESQWSDTMGTNWNTWKCDQCNVVAAKGWEHTRDGSKPNGKFCSECGVPMDKKVIFINITEKE